MEIRVFQEVEEGQGIEWAGEGRADHRVTMQAMMCTRKTFYARFRTAVCAQLIVVQCAGRGLCGGVPLSCRRLP